VKASRAQYACLVPAPPPPPPPPPSNCTFQPHCDYGHGSRERAPASSKEECCSLCHARAGCVAGVLTGGDCFFKTAQDVEGGCVKASRAQYACQTPFFKDLELLEKKYHALLNSTCREVVAKAPTLPGAGVAVFMAAFKNHTVAYIDPTQVLAAAQPLLSLPAVKTFLSAEDSFDTPRGMDAISVRCAVLFQGTPGGLAAFAAQSKGNKALLEKLFGDATLMRDMLVAGGAVGSEDQQGSPFPARYGQAMAIYSKIVNASTLLSNLSSVAATTRDDLWDDRSQLNILRRVALGTALRHAVPIQLRFNRSVVVDPVQRYLHYESRYRSGYLDPAFEVMTAFECSHATNSDASNDDLDWFRETLANYRPEHMVIGGVTTSSWRYARAVKTDVEYGDPQCGSFKKGVCNGSYSMIPAAGGVCGPRAFFGRFTRQAFGLPVWGATQPKHAAMSTWSPGGWSVLLGAWWSSSWWGARGGIDFVTEAWARENRTSYQQVLRGSWVSNALGEEPAGARENCPDGVGGTWAALMWAAKMISVGASAKDPYGRQPAARVVGKSIVPTKIAALVAKWPVKPPPPAISTDDGKITIPAVAFSSKNRSASLGIMQSAGPGEQLMHSGCYSTVGPPCLAPESSSFDYEVTVSAAGIYYLTANHTTWHPQQDLLLSINGSPAATVPVYYTFGWWIESQPIEVKLIAGKNVLHFTRTSIRELVFKEFFLWDKKPIVPPQPGNFTPAPTPPTPPPTAYIEVCQATNMADSFVPHSVYSLTLVFFSRVCVGAYHHQLRKARH
jgi:hypothetical protein